MAPIQIIKHICWWLINICKISYVSQAKLLSGNFVHAVKFSDE